MLPPRKAFYIITLLSLITCDSARAQMVYATKSSVDADVKVYVTKYETDADLIVYKTAAQTDAAGNKGIWYFAPYLPMPKRKFTLQTPQQMPM